MKMYTITTTNNPNHTCDWCEGKVQATRKIRNNNAEWTNYACEEHYHTHFTSYIDFPEVAEVIEPTIETTQIKTIAKPKSINKILSFITILTISLSLLISPIANACNQNNYTYSKIFYVKSSNYDYYTGSNLYISWIMDENGDIWVIESFDDISGQWLDAEINSNYEITDYTILN